MKLQDTKGIIPTTVPEEEDEVDDIYFCAGPTGAVMMFIAAYQVFGEVQYIEAAKKCGDTIWEKGSTRLVIRRRWQLCLFWLLQ